MANQLYLKENELKKDFIEIKAKVPFIKIDTVGNILKISEPSVKAGKVYRVPDTDFWRKEAVEDKGRYRLAEKKVKAEAETEIEVEPIAEDKAKDQSGPKTQSKKK